MSSSHRRSASQPSKSHVDSGPTLHTAGLENQELMAGESGQVRSVVQYQTRLVRTLGILSGLSYRFMGQFKIKLMDGRTGSRTTDNKHRIDTPRVVVRRTTLTEMR